MLYHDNETNFIYFSSVLQKRYPVFYKSLSTILDKNSIQYGLIEQTKDIWCRDYMPIQTRNGELVYYRYTPDYLVIREDIRTDPKTVSFDNKILQSHTTKDMDLVVDGGNIIRTKNKVLLTDKIYTENLNFSKIQIEKMLIVNLGVENIVIIPKQPYEYTGHADGLIRMLDEHTVLLNDISLESKSYKNKLEKKLEKNGFEVIRLEYTKEFFASGRDWGSYINYLHVGNFILVPTLGINEDERVLKAFEKIFPNETVTSIDSNEIISEGGALNCISWNIRL